MSEYFSPSQPTNGLAEVSIYSGIEYFQELSKDISSAHSGDRAAIMTMGFDPEEPLAREVIAQLNDAAERNVGIVFGVDAFAVMEPRSIGPIVMPLAFARSEVMKRYAVLETLADYPSARYGIINMPNTFMPNLFAGRSHIKVAVINEQVYIGGPSFQGCERIDMVAGLKDKDTSNWIYDLATAVTDSGGTDKVLGDRDQVRTVDANTDIIVDAGVPGQSLILDLALDTIDQAQDWLIIACQFLPTGKTARSLVNAIDRGVDVHIAYNHPSKYDRMNLAHRLILLRERVRRPEEFFAHQVPMSRPALHTKAMANESTGIIGSHNFINTGVELGTPEMALLRRDQGFAMAIRNAILQEVEIENPDS